MSPNGDDRVRVAPIMREIEGDVRSRIRRRLVERGVSAYADEDLFERVVALLQHAADGRSLDALLVPELLADVDDWSLDPSLRLSSHRPLFGSIVLFAKRRLVMPLTRWLFEYSQRNFQRQERMNRMLLACIEELAIENARLRREIDAIARSR